MNAIKAIRKYIEQHPETAAARTLAHFAAALAEEREFPLAELYAIDYDAFELALELLRDWRLDRYYASRLRLYDLVQSEFVSA